MTKNEKRFEAAKAAMQAMTEPVQASEEKIAAWSVEQADALLAALGESAPGVPELPEVGLGHAIVDEDGDWVESGGRVENGKVAIGIGCKAGRFAAYLTPPQLLELAALCIAHYREMVKGGAT